MSGDKDTTEKKVRKKEKRMGRFILLLLLFILEIGGFKEADFNYFLTKLILCLISHPFDLTAHILDITQEKCILVYMP